MPSTPLISSGTPSLDPRGQFLYEMGILVFIFGKTARVAKVGGWVGGGQGWF